MPDHETADRRKSKRRSKELCLEVMVYGGTASVCLAKRGHDYPHLWWEASAVRHVDMSDLGRPSLKDQVFKVISTWPGPGRPCPSDVIEALCKPPFEADVKNALWHLLGDHEIVLTRGLGLATNTEVGLAELEFPDA